MLKKKKKKTMWKTACGPQSLKYLLNEILDNSLLTPDLNSASGNAEKGSWNMFGWAEFGNGLDVVEKKGI